MVIGIGVVILASICAGVLSGVLSPWLLMEFSEWRIYRSVDRGAGRCGHATCRGAYPFGRCRWRKGFPK